MAFDLAVNLLINSTIMASLLVILILLLKRILKNRMSAKWHYIIWFILILRLAVPYAVYSPLNITGIFNEVAVNSSVDVKDLQTSLGTPVSGIENNSSQLQNQSQSNISNSSDTAAKTQKNSLYPGKLAKWLKNLKINYRMLFIIWIAGVVVLGLYAFLYNIYFWSKVKNGSVFTDQAVIELLEECKERLGVRTNISIIQTTGVSIPAVFGVTRPWLLMPEKVLRSLEYERLRYVILHELAHLKRKDIIVNWVALIFQIIHWFNPFIWLAFKKMRTDRELACDADVLKHLDRGEEKKYGHTILDMVEIISGRLNYAGIAGILEDKSQIKDRISMISRFSNRSNKLSLVSIIIIGLLASSTLVNASNFTGKTLLNKDTANSTSVVGSSTFKDSDVKTDSAEDEGKNSVQVTLNPNDNKNTSYKNSNRASKGLKVTEGITVTTEITTNVTTNVLTKMHTAFVYKDKLPAGMPELINMFLISTDDVSESSIQNWATSFKGNKLVSWQFDGRSGEYHHWTDDNTKYSLILLFDSDMNYLGYYIYQNL